MNDIMSIATMRHIEMEASIRNHQLIQQAVDVEKIEYSRFLKAYQLRALLNRLTPGLAPRLGL